MYDLLNGKCFQLLEEEGEIKEQSAVQENRLEVFWDCL